MGELINLNPSAIPDEIARDIEVTAEINAHVTQTDPHTQYLLQTEGDSRYRQSEQGITAKASTQITGISGGTIWSETNNSGLQVQARDSNSAAYLSLHRPGIYAIHMGLDTDNQLKVGGWSMGNASYKIWHEGNLPQTILTKVIAGQVSATTQGGTVNISHGLDVGKILAVAGRIEMTSGQAAFASSGLPNASFFVWAASTTIVVTNLAGSSSLILGKPLTLTITHTV